MLDRLRRWWLGKRVNAGMVQLAKNPLLGYPRNTPCWCGSGAKAKKCCLPKQPSVVPVKNAAMLAHYMSHVRAAA